jgi:hypothetical protein
VLVLHRCKPTESLLPDLLHRLPEEEDNGPSKWDWRQTEYGLQESKSGREQHEEKTAVLPRAGAAVVAIVGLPGCLPEGSTRRHGRTNGHAKSTVQLESIGAEAMRVYGKL